MAFGTQDEPDEVMNEINMTPLVDVMLVLLIIFIITVPVMKHAVNVDLPRATNQVQDVKPQTIRLTVDAAERMAQRTITEIYVNVSGGRPQSQRYIGSVPTQGGQVAQHDMNRALDAALDQVDPGRRSIMHITPLQYHLDDASGIKEPAGLFGDNLALDLSVVTVQGAAPSEICDWSCNWPIGATAVLQREQWTNVASCRCAAVSSLVARAATVELVSAAATAPCGRV